VFRKDFWKKRRSDWCVSHAEQYHERRGDSPADQRGGKGFGQGRHMPGHGNTGEIDRCHSNGKGDAWRLNRVPHSALCNITKRL